jgi:hypothetical protein
VPPKRPSFSIGRFAKKYDTTGRNLTRPISGRMSPMTSLSARSRSFEIGRSFDRKTTMPGLEGGSNTPTNRSSEPRAAKGFRLRIARRKTIDESNETVRPQARDSCLLNP